ncbi:MAG: hypothetical protein KF834_02135 [Burkholderiales bacterium]|nr:hypothetical protein [Burkholderiales bacterium]
MNKTVISTAAVAAVLGVVGIGGCQHPADRDQILGESNSPQVKNFKATLDRYLAQTLGYYSQPCVGMPSTNPRSSGFKDTRVDHTPVGFRVSLDARNDPVGNIKARLAYLEKQGFIQSRPNANGSHDYSMTWKGFAATNTNGCLNIASVEREAKVIGFEKVRADNDVEIYRVTASIVPKSVEPWAQTPEFRDIFSSYSRILRDPDPVVYELARSDVGFVVLKEKGQPARTLRGEAAGITMRLVGTLTAERVKAVVQSYVARRQNHSSNTRVCMPQPRPAEVDRITPDRFDYKAIGDKSISLDIYNLPGRNASDNQAKMRGYALLRRFEALGLAKSEPLNHSEFNGKPVSGGVRFELNRELANKFSTAPSGCILLGVLQVEEIIRFSQFNYAAQPPRFVARMALKPVDDEARRIIAEFGNLSRISEVGVAMIGSLEYKDGELQVLQTEVRIPSFFPDISGLQLPKTAKGSSWVTVVAASPLNVSR